MNATTAARILAATVAINALASPVLGASIPSPLQPFAVNSPWNSRPVDPVLDDFEIPKSDFYPAVQQGAYSSGVFVADATSASVVVKGYPDKPGVWDPDAEENRPEITIPRWPEGVIPASGSDGHADIVDPVDGIVHSFLKLRQVDGQWRAAMYAWTRLDGRGWGDPQHYFQGARAAAVPPIGGIIRKHEIHDGQTLYPHALAMSLTYNGLSASPTYIYPATSADGDAARRNSGGVPEGALLMLPKSFDVEAIKTPELQKICRTLQTYGAYVVDRNVGTPFVIYVENGSDFTLQKDGRWNPVAGADLDRMRAALRQVKATKGWLDADGKAFEPQTRFNLLSMRGKWVADAGNPGGAATAVFDTWKQAVVIRNSSAARWSNFNGRGIAGVSWARPQSGQSYELRASIEGQARMQMVLVDQASKRASFESKELRDGESQQFAWPEGEVKPVLRVLVKGGDVTATGSLTAAGK